MNPNTMLDEFDHTTVLARLGGDEELLQEVMALYLDECPRLLEEVRGAMDGQDAARLRRAAHSLKGATSNFSTGVAYQAAAQLEMRGATPDLARAETDFQVLATALSRLQAQITRV